MHTDNSARHLSVGFELQLKWRDIPLLSIASPLKNMASYGMRHFALSKSAREEDADARYRITVHTGDVRGGGTRAVAYVCLDGGKRHYLNEAGTLIDRGNSCCDFWVAADHSLYFLHISTA